MDRVLIIYEVKDYEARKNCIVPTLRPGNASCDAQVSRNAVALLDEFPRRSVGTIEI
jgi:hypothetical protein